MKEYIIVKNDNIEYLRFIRLEEFADKLIHAIFLKKHDIGFNLDKNIEVREKSVEIIRKTFDINSKIVQSKQVHSNNIKILLNNNENSIMEGYDGFISSEPGIGSIITFADCIPVFIYDPKNNVYANIHSGWRGVVNKISLKAIEILKNEFNSNLSDLICCIGPNIGKECFLVNNDLVEIYNSSFKEYIKKYQIIEETDQYNEKGKQYRIDNNLLLEKMLIQHGIIEKNIINANICTVCNSDDFHSRRAEGVDFQKGGGLMMLK